MSQFGNAPKNPPWARSAQQAMGAGVAPQHMQSQLMGQMNPAVMVQYQQQQQQQQQQQVYQQMQQPMQQAGMMSGMGGMGQSGLAPMYPQGVATVSYPTPRALNPTAFSQQQQQVVSAAPVPPASAAPAPKQRVFTGTVSKMHDNFGFVDEDVFFQTSCCVKGSNPVAGDRVLVEASYNPQMPFKWNATRIQVLPMTGIIRSQQGGQGGGMGQQGGGGGGGMGKGGGYNAVPPPMENSSGFGGGGLNRGQKRMRGGRDRSKERGGGGGGRGDDDDEAERKRRREERQREREDKEKAAAPSSQRSRPRSKSPRPVQRRRARVVPRYMVQIPKIALDLPEADVLELRRRYSNMYIPSDFFCTNFRWVDAFPPHRPFALDRPCSYHVLSKEVDPVGDNPAVLEPADADYLFSAKVMLISMPGMDEMIRKCCTLAEDKDASSSGDGGGGGSGGGDRVHPTRLVNFLVGLRGKNETMAVGGPWSPSLDGADPAGDPSVLIKTAVRSCRALTGVDLSHCTQWYRFLELYYRRGETTSKGRPVPARVETVVLFLPDVWSCVPTRLEYDALLGDYRRQLDRKTNGAATAATAAGGAAATAAGAEAGKADEDAEEKARNKK